MWGISTLDFLALATPLCCFFFYKKKDHSMLLLSLSLLVLSQVHAGRISYLTHCIPSMEFRNVHLNQIYNKTCAIERLILNDVVKVYLI